MKYQEEKDFCRVYKENYVSGLDAILEAREQECESNRRKYSQHIFEHPLKS